LENCDILNNRKGVKMSSLFRIFISTLLISLGFWVYTVEFRLENLYIITTKLSKTADFTNIVLDNLIQEARRYHSK